MTKIGTEILFFSVLERLQFWFADRQNRAESVPVEV